MGTRGQNAKISGRFVLARRSHSTRAMSLPIEPDSSRYLALPFPVASRRPPLVSRALARMRASVWIAVAIKCGAVVAALVVLGWIGRTAAAGSNQAPIATSESDASASADSDARFSDAGAQPVTMNPVALSAAIASVLSTPPGSVGAPSSPGVRGRATADEPVFLNHASVDELRRLPGVGPKRAEAILVLRQRLGHFQRVEDLLRTKGIGRAAVKKWRPLVRLDTPEAGTP